MPEQLLKRNCRAAGQHKQLLLAGWTPGGAVQNCCDAITGPGRCCLEHDAPCLLAPFKGHCGTMTRHGIMGHGGTRSGGAHHKLSMPHELKTLASCTLKSLLR